MKPWRSLKINISGSNPQNVFHFCQWSLYQVSILHCFRDINTYLASLTASELEQSINSLTTLLTYDLLPYLLSGSSRSALQLAKMLGQRS